MANLGHSSGINTFFIVKPDAHSPVLQFISGTAGQTANAA
jgi:hypothetical protein